MYLLFDDVYVDHIDHLNSNTQRYIIGSGIEDHFLESEDDRLSKSLGIPELAQTCYYTKDVDDFITSVFPDELELLCDRDRPVVIFCDDEAYVKLFCFWVRHLFPKLSHSALCELAFLLFLNRERSESTFIWGSETTTPNFIKRCMTEMSRSDVVFEFLNNHHEHLPVEYRLLGHMAGEEDTTLPTRLRHRLYRAINDQIETQRSKLGYLYFSPHIKKMLGELPTATLTMNSPLRDIEGLKVVSREVDLEDVFSSSEKIVAFKEGYQHDLRKLLNTINTNTYLETNVREMTVPIELLELPDDEIVDGYIDAYTQLDRLTLIVPPMESRMFTTNLVFWALANRASGNPVKVGWAD